MSEKKAETMTKVVGYFNPQKFPIFVEISQINLKAELAPNAYIRDRQGRFINDPIFEPYCHQKGLSRAISDQPVPINYVPRLMKVERPTAAVTQAKSFVRQTDGRTVPVYSKQAAQESEIPASKNPVTKMSVDQARKLGLIGRPILLSEDYGADETSGAPIKGGAIPEIRYSRETPGRIKTSDKLRPELTEVTGNVSPDDLPPQIAEGVRPLSPAEQAERAQLQKSLKQASSQTPGDQFDPATISPASAKPKAKAKTAVTPVTPKPVVAPKTIRRRVAAPVQAEPVAPISVEPEAEAQELTEATGETEALVDQRGSGIVEPLDGDHLPAPNLEEPPATGDGKRFVCAADGSRFQYRSQLERYVKRNFPNMTAELLAPYPPT